MHACGLRNSNLACSFSRHVYLQCCGDLAKISRVWGLKVRSGIFITVKRMLRTSTLKCLLPFLPEATQGL